MARKFEITFDGILSELCKGCHTKKHPESSHDPCTWCRAPFVSADIGCALKLCTPTRHRVPFYSDPRDNVPPAGYVVMAVYGGIVGIIAERQYKRALKNEYVNQTYGIWYAVNFPVFIQRPDGSLYLPRDPEHDH